MWLRFSLTLLVLLILPSISLSQVKTKLQGFCQDGGKKVSTQGLTSSTSVQQSFPSCTITVFDSGTATLSTIYSNSSGSVKTNPFTAASNGLWFFYGNPGQHYDIRFSSGGITTPFTLGDQVAPVSGITGVTNVKTDYGAKGDARLSSTGSMAPSSSTLNCSGCAFASSDIGKKIDVAGVGAFATLTAVITSFISTTQVTLSIAASYTSSGQTATLDTATISTASMTAGSTTLTVGSSWFTSTDVNKLISVTVVGAKNISGTISSVNSSTQAVLSVSSSTLTTTASNRRVIFGTDDSIAVQSAITNNGVVYFPTSNYLIGSSITITGSNKTIFGDGMASSSVYQVGPTMLNTSSAFIMFFLTPPCSNIDFHNIGLSGTNWTAQTTSFGNDPVSFGVASDVFGPINGIRVNSCRFDSFWGIGFQAPGSAAIVFGESIFDYRIINCYAQFNSYDGFNPGIGANLIMQGCTGRYNGTAGLETGYHLGGVFTGNIFEYNAQAGMVVGGFVDPEVILSTTITGNSCNYNGTTGITISGNIQSAAVVGNSCVRNGLIGINLDLTGGSAASLFRDLRVESNVIDTNGSTKIGSATSGIQCTATKTVIANNTIINRTGTTGYSQQIGINVPGGGTANIIIQYNFVSGHITDYSIGSGATITSFADEFNGIVSNLGTINYATRSFASVTINSRLSLVPTVVADTSLSPFVPTGLTTVYVTLTGNRTIDPNLGVDGQILNLVFVQDGTGNRTLTYTSTFRGATNISAGQAAGKVNTQSFIFSATANAWLALGPAVQNM